MGLWAGCGDGGTGAPDDGVALPDGDDGTGADGDGDAPLDELGAGDAEDAPDAPDLALPPVAAAPVVDLLPAADPKMPGFDGWPIAFDVHPNGRSGLRCRVVLSRGATTLASLAAAVDAERCAVPWDGLASDGSWLLPGPLKAAAEILPAAADDVLATAEADLEVVRLGLHGVQLAPGPTGKRVDLLWAETDGEAEGYYEAARDSTPWNLDRDAAEPEAAVDLELADGAPRALPDPWEDVKSPPLDPASDDGVEHDTYDLPTAWVAGSSIEASARLSADVAGAPGGGAPAECEVRVVAPAGTRLVGGGAFEPGSTIVVRSETSPVPAVGRWDWALEWRFEARRGDGPWVPVPGSLPTVHRLYGLVGVPSFERAGVPYRAWVEVVDLVAGWVDGATADPVAVAGHIVAGVYYELGLRYDNMFGASAYTEYLSDWYDQVFYIVAFQRRDNGSRINCSDAAGIVASYANMVGIDLRYHIVQHAWADGFDLNYIQPIGFTGFTETPFLSGGGSFGYHAVVGPADGTVYDATLALDGDGTPTAPPHELLLAQGLAPDDYLFDLSSDWEDVVIHIDDKVLLR